MIGRGLLAVDLLGHRCAGDGGGRRMAVMSPSVRVLRGCSGRGPRSMTSRPSLGYGGTGRPVRMSVRFSVRANSPFSVGPQCATVSPSKTGDEAEDAPGRSSITIRWPQQRRGLGRRLARNGSLARRRGQGPVDRDRAHHKQLGPDLRRVAGLPCTSFPARMRPAACASTRPFTCRTRRRRTPTPAAAPSARPWSTSVPAVACGLMRVVSLPPCNCRPGTPVRTSP